MFVCHSIILCAAMTGQSVGKLTFILGVFSPITDTVIGNTPNTKVRCKKQCFLVLVRFE